jgi:hypothetical protein
MKGKEKRIRWIKDTIQLLLIALKEERGKLKRMQGKTLTDIEWISERDIF